MKENHENDHLGGVQKKRVYSGEGSNRLTGRNKGSRR